MRYCDNYKYVCWCEDELYIKGVNKCVIRVNLRLPVLSYALFLVVVYYISMKPELCDR